MITLSGAMHASGTLAVHCCTLSGQILAMTMDVKPDGTSCVSVVLLWALLQVLT